MTDYLSEERVPILVVDDQKNNILVIEGLLDDMGLPLLVVTADSGQRALRLSLTQTFALILLDVQMPEMNGYEVAELLRAHPKTKHTPIIFVTAGMNAEHHVIQGYDSGAVDYLPKPLDRHQLKSKVRVFFELFQQRRALEQHEAFLEEEVNRRSEELRILNAELEQRVEERSKQLNLALAKVIEVERHIALNNMVVGVAHELNTPIGVVLLAATSINNEVILLQELINSEHVSRSKLLATGERLTNGAVLIENNAKRASDLVSKFKQLSARMEEGAAFRFNFHSTIADELSKQSQLLQEAKVIIEQDIDVDIWMDGIPSDLQKIISLLVSNSLTHAFHQMNEPRIFLKAGVIENTVHFRFGDNGSGVLREHLPRLFDPFFTTRLGRGGSGLGLTTVYSLAVEKMGGTVEATSESGQGLCLEFSWKISPKQEKE